MVDTINSIIRQPLVKILSRVLLYGTASLLALSAGTTFESASSQPAVGPAVVNLSEALGAVILLVLGGLLDRWHNKTDRAEVPKTAPHDGASL